MYGLDKTVDLAFLVGKQLTQVCIGLYQLILNFEDGISISVEGVFEYDGTTGSAGDGGPHHAACSLLDAIGKEPEEVQVIDGGTLVLKFRNGGDLRLVDSNEATESYQIVGPNSDIVV